METLDGIMIATTNLQQNMDKAFERRFLHKIKFEKPTEEARTHISCFPQWGVPNRWLEFQADGIQ